MEKSVLLTLLADSSGSKDMDSDSSDCSDVEVLLKFWAQPRRKRNCIRNYFEEVVPRYTSDEFRTHFRISRELFNSLSTRYQESANFQNLREDKRISASKHMAVFLWFAGHEACSYRDIGDRFDLCIWAVEHTIQRIIYFISNLCDEVFKWPDESGKQEIARYFEAKSGFSGVIGAIDGTHVVIDPPRKSKDDYIDRKGDYSLCLQGICDNNGKFTDICIGFPGSVHDSRVLQNSPIFPKLESLCGDYYILGDSAYPCLKHLLPPYRDNGHLTSEQKYYNKQLSSCRVVIEHAFGILKQRFRQLYYCKLRGASKLCHFIRACCVLHNLADQNDFQPEDIAEEEEPPPPPTFWKNTSSGNFGRVLRNKISQEMWRKRRK